MEVTIKRRAFIERASLMTSFSTFSPFLTSYRTTKDEFKNLKLSTMKTGHKVILVCFGIIFNIILFTDTNAQNPVFEFEFGNTLSIDRIISGCNVEGTPIKWLNVNTDKETWLRQNDILVCRGDPIGVIRSENQYENFILHIEWRHMEPGGNSGVFVWSAAVPRESNRLPDGVEVQMLELDWVKLHKREDFDPPLAYVHGELFGVGGVETVPDNPRGRRSKSIENRCKGKGEWNYYDIVCVDGVIKLSVNGKFVNGISKAAQKKGYICLESEGAEIQFRNLRIITLPPGVTSPDQTAPIIN